MSQQQVNTYHQPTSQTLVNQQWGAPYAVHQHFYGGGQGFAAPPFVQISHMGGPQWPVPDAHIPGFTHMGHGVHQQQPHFGGTNVQSHTRHVCPRVEGVTERGHGILRILCNDLVERSQHTRDCGLVGDKVSRDCVKLFDQDEKKAKDKFWRRAQKSKSQRAGRAEVKQQIARAKQPDLTQQWSANTQIYLQQMVDGNTGNFQADADMGLNGIVPNHNVGNPVQVQQEVPQALPPKDVAKTALQTILPFDMSMDPHPASHVYPALFQHNIYGVDS
jgi:hypothetical protein